MEGPPRSQQTGSGPGPSPREPKLHLYRPTHMVRHALVALAVVLLVGSCGDPTGGGSAASTEPSSELEYGCGGGATFSPEEIEEGPEPSQDILDALHDLRQTMDGAMLPEDGWTVVSRRDSAVTLLAPQEGRGHVGFASASFDKEADGWKAAGWGDCTPRLALLGKSVLRWAFTEQSHPPPPDATELEVLVIEVECSSGRSLDGLIEPNVTYREDRIEVVLTAPGGIGGNCIGTAPTEYSLELDEPVGQRKVVDLSVYPVAEPAPGTRLP